MTTELTPEKRSRYETLLDRAMYGLSMTREEWEEMKVLSGESTGEPWPFEEYDDSYNVKGSSREKKV